MIALKHIQYKKQNIKKLFNNYKLHMKKRLYMICYIVYKYGFKYNENVILCRLFADMEG